MENDFIRDYNFASINGLLHSENSVLKIKNGSYFTNVNSQVIMFTILSGEIINRFGTQTETISCFEILDDDKLIIGYHDGRVELFNSLNQQESIVYKFFSSKVTNISVPSEKINNSDTTIFITSSDSRICLFDYQLYSTFFIDVNSSVLNVCLYHTNIYIACCDNSIKIVNCQSREEVDILILKNPLKDITLNNDEIIVFFDNGDSCIIDLARRKKGDSVENIKRKFCSFSKIKQISKTGNELLVQCKKKLFCFNLKKNYNLKFVEDIKANVISVFIENSSKIYLLNDNTVKVDETVKTFGFHSSEIIQVRTQSNYIYSLSKENLIIWMKTESGLLKFISKHKCEDLAECFEIIEDFIYIGTSSGLYKINKFSHSSEKILGGKIKCINMSNNDSLVMMVVVIDTKLCFYNHHAVIIKEMVISESEPIFATFSSNGLLAVSCLDSKVYIYNMDNFTLKLTLYGHSLPCRFLQFSPNNDLLATCGLDKLVKLYDLTHGDCRKTFIGDSVNLNFLTNDVFLFSYNGFLTYYHKFNPIRKFKVSTKGFLCSGDDFFVYTDNQGLMLFTMNSGDMLFDYDPEKEALDQILVKDMRISNADKYDVFLSYIEKIENGAENIEKDLFRFLLSGEMDEVLEYFTILDSTAIEIICKVLEKCYEINIIFSAKIFLKLLSCHKNTIVSLKNFVQLKNKLLDEISVVRNEIGETCSRFRLHCNYLE